MEKRNIKSEEHSFICELLKLKKLFPEDYNIAKMVTDYEGAVMGSIGLGKDEAEYAGDIIQVKYVDTDQVPVIITLTRDKENYLLDLDFWKEDFSKLIAYPQIDQVEIIL